MWGGFFFGVGVFHRGARGSGVPQLVNPRGEACLSQEDGVLLLGGVGSKSVVGSCLSASPRPLSCPLADISPTLAARSAGVSKRGREGRRLVDGQPSRLAQNHTHTHQKLNTLQFLVWSFRWVCVWFLGRGVLEGVDFGVWGLGGRDVSQGLRWRGNLAGSLTRASDMVG